MSVGPAIQELHDAERELAALLTQVSEQHADEHDVHHMCQSLGAKAQERVGLLEDAGAQAGEPARPQSDGDLLADLRALHLAACRASIGWVVLGQGAQALRDEALLDMTTERHPEAIQVMKWTTTRIKQAAPQALSG
jgi:hypothetical protein